MLAAAEADGARKLVPVLERVVDELDEFVCAATSATSAKPARDLISHEILLMATVGTSVRDLCYDWTPGAYRAAERGCKDDNRRPTLRQMRGFSD